MSKCIIFIQNEINVFKDHNTSNNEIKIIINEEMAFFNG